MPELEVFGTLIADAEHCQRNAIGVDEFEPRFVAVLSFIKSNPELRPRIVEKFAELLRDRSSGPYTLIEFCMFDLRWPEMRMEAETIFETSKAEVIRGRLHGTPSQHLHYLESCVSAFGHAWEDKDLFSYYRNHK